MKKIILIFTLFLFSCNVQAQDGNYKIMWDYNDPIEGVTYYNVFLIELSDTTASPFTEGQLADEIRVYQIASPIEASLKSVNADTAIYNFVQSENGLYIQAALTAVNGYGESLVAVSGFYKKPYILLPNNVNIIRIGK